MTKAEYVIRFSLGATILFLVCVGITSVAIVAHALIDPLDVTRPPRICPPSELKQALDEIKYGAVNRDKQNEIKDGFLDRFRTRRQSRIGTFNQPCSPQTVQRCQQSPTQYRHLDDPCGQTGTSQLQTQVTAAVVEYPSITPLISPVRLKIDCPTCPSAELKTGAFICSNCRNPQVGDQWHTEWRTDGTPLTYLCRQCNDKLSPAQKESVLRSYLHNQMATGAAAVGSLAPEVSR